LLIGVFVTFIIWAVNIIIKMESYVRYAKLRNLRIRKRAMLESTLGRWILMLIIIAVVVAILVTLKGDMGSLFDKISETLSFGG